MNQLFQKVDYAAYERAFDSSILSRMHHTPQDISIEDMRSALYGYTFTQSYAEGEIPDEFFMDYWRDRGEAEQEELLLQTLHSSGDGKSPETALCVIDVHQEYEYIARVLPFSRLRMTRQSFSDGIDCLEFKSRLLDADERIYFDISRRFEVG